MIESDVIQNLLDNGFELSQINQLVKFNAEDYKFVFVFKKTAPKSQIRLIRKIYDTGQFSDYNISSFIRLVNDGVDLSCFFDEEFKSKFNASQIEALSKTLIYNKEHEPKDFSKLFNPGFEKKQILVLIDYIINGKVNDKIFNPEINELNLKLILDAAKRGIDDDIFYNPAFNPDQLTILINAKEDKIDISKINNPEIEASCMAVFAKAALSGVDISEFFEVPNFQSFVKEDYSIFTTAKKNGFDLTYFKNTEFSSSQRKFILDGMLKGYDVSIYADPSVESVKMSLVLCFLSEGFDPVPFMGKHIPFKKMELALQALKIGLDKDFILDPAVMPSELEAVINLCRKGYHLISKEDMELIRSIV